MRAGITVAVNKAVRARLEAIVGDWNNPQKHVWRARIVLLTTVGLGTSEIMRRTGTGKVTVWRWQERFMTAGVGGVLRDKTRPPRIAPLPPRIHERAVASRRSAERSHALDGHDAGRARFSCRAARHLRVPRGGR
jgi:hypothetical protein